MILIIVWPGVLFCIGWVIGGHYARNIAYDRLIKEGLISPLQAYEYYEARQLGYSDQQMSERCFRREGETGCSR